MTDNTLVRLPIQALQDEEGMRLSIWFEMVFGAAIWHAALINYLGSEIVTGRGATAQAAVDEVIEYIKREWES